MRLRVLASVAGTCAAVITSSGCARQPDPPAGPEPAWLRILREGTRLESFLEPPAPGEKVRVFTSSLDTNKAMLCHLAQWPLGDVDHAFFLRVAKTNGMTEATLAETRGPGAITWMWSANPVGTLRLYIDDPDRPALEMPFKDFLLGRFVGVPYPFCSYTSLGYNLYLPITHTSYCRVALAVPDAKELSELYYQVAWRALPSSPGLEPFSPGQVRAFGRPLATLAKETIDSCKFAPIDRDPETVQLVITNLPPGGAVACPLPAGATAIDALQVSTNDKSALAGLRLQLCWDGDDDPAVDAPLYMLAGASDRADDLESAPVAIENGTCLLRWIMPCGAGSRLQLVNEGNSAVQVRVNVRPHALAAGPSRARFHAEHVRHRGVSVEYMNVLEVGTMDGPGRVAGFSIHVKDKSTSWWGEGDVIVRLDDLGKPVWNGTGTEDYFGLAWGYRNGFDHPWRGQVESDGFTYAMRRFHFLDTLPYTRLCRFDQEVRGTGKGTVDYETLLSWYAYR